MKLGFKLLTKDDHSLNATHGAVHYPPDGSWVEVPGNGAYVAVIGGATSAGSGPTIAVLECDVMTRKCVEAPHGVECFGRVRRRPDLETALKAYADLSKAYADWSKAYADLSKAYADWSKADADWLKADWLKAKAYANWSKANADWWSDAYSWLRNQEVKMKPRPRSPKQRRNEMVFDTKKARERNQVAGCSDLLLACDEIDALRAQVQKMREALPLVRAVALAIEKWGIEGWEKAIATPAPSHPEAGRDAEIRAQAFEEAAEIADQPGRNPDTVYALRDMAAKSRRAGEGDKP
jgi:hypothetical protein